MGLGTSLKETTLHHYRDPFADLLKDDPEMDLAAVIIMGSADDTPTKMLASDRTAQTLAAMGVDGAILSCNGFGNNHIDYANLIEQVGKKGIPFVAMSACEAEDFVVKNAYLSHVLPFYKTSGSEDSGVLAENTVTVQDAKLAIAMLRLKMRQQKEH